ncbi:MAG: DUF1553 domain-containing protein [Armatimonadetes bacterium]|nr:DUF1553 domain-containing protein [Armatimonadota bacterium]
MLRNARPTMPLAMLATGAFVTLVCVTLSFAASSPPTKAPVREKLDYNRDIRPILSKCFSCHGQDSKALQAGLRLDQRAGATKVLPSGERAIVPGDPARSELIQRIYGSGPVQMPPLASHKTLSEAEKQTLNLWIAEGAEYKPHWAFVRPVRPPLPAIHLKSWPRNGIDYFVLARLEQTGLKPSPEADRTTLLRRVTLDLTGLPPTPQETDAFLADKSPNAYEKVVDRLLGSPRYGEHMAANWMDIARYADSNGYQADYERFQWRWRDWVIDAFNHNMPYNEFVMEQLAGDMLPNATLSQKIATGFGRNHRINTEGGVIPEEWRTETVIDRVETTSAAFLGLTMGCARCHDHKYDPIPQRDFYGFYAYFNNVPETGSGVEQPVNHPPFIASPTPEQERQRAALTARLAGLDAQLAAKERAGGTSPAAEQALADANARLDVALDPHLTLTGAPPGVVITGKPVFEPVAHASGTVTLDGASALDVPGKGDFERDEPFSYGCYVNPATGNGSPVSRMDAGDSFRGWDIYLADGRPSVHLIHHWPDNALKVTARDTIPSGQWSHLLVTYDGTNRPSGIKLYINGKLAGVDVASDTLTDTIRTLKPFRVGGRTGADGFAGQVDDVRVYSRVLPPEDAARLAQDGPLLAAQAVPAGRRTDAQRLALIRYALHATDAEYRQLADDRAQVAAARDALDAAIPTTMVMEEMPKPRECHVLIRGQYDHPGDTVTAHLPAAFGHLPPGAPNNRLGLAEWIASPDNPLTARVAVNRFWEKFFGTGIVATSEDFGVRAEFPSHPELLDWLATEFVRRGWDMKAIQREIVLSATYRQSSAAAPAQWRRDPDNRLLARGPRLRLPAEVIRDQALAVSGLLVEKIGGPSVRPYQPDGIWDELSVYGNLRDYHHDQGEGLYRRSLYTIWKRTAAPPLMTLFDVPTRETCRVRRARTDTPLQALALLNDETFLEASRVLAEHMLTQGGATPAARITYAFRRAVGRRPTPAELRVLCGGVQKRLARYRVHPAAATKLVSIGDTPRDPKIAVPELAAYTTTASVILNMDETITKE